MIKQALKDKPLPVYGNGQNIRDWIHVTDHCRDIDLIVHSGRPGEVYNIGGNCEIRNIEIVKFILRYLNKSDSLITFVPDRKGHDLRYAVDFSKIEKAFGWRPEISFQRGMEETIQWYVKHW